MRRIPGVVALLASATACAQSGEDIAEDIGCRDAESASAVVAGADAVDCVIEVNGEDRSVHIETFDDVPDEEVEEAFSGQPGFSYGVLGEGWVVQTWQEDAAAEVAREVGGDVMALGALA